jgi:hypothetical protein
VAPGVQNEHAMKKSRSKMSLNRETLRHLDKDAMKKAGGGWVCKATNAASTCVSQVDTECNCQPTYGCTLDVNC